MSELPVFTLAALEATPPAVLPSFSKEDAWRLGSIAAQSIVDSGLNLAVDIVADGDLIFRAKFGSTGPENDEWLARKAAAARRFGVPSLLVRRRSEADPDAFTDATEDASLAMHGGSVPLYVGDDLVATITMSGEPDVIDHEMCAGAVANYLASL
jgi:uncharacterized protein (UPF0303 family)